MFRNHTLDSHTGEAKTNANELFVFLLGSAHAHGERGERVEIRYTPESNQLKLRLLDQQNQEIDSATLQRGVDFDFSDGFLVLRGPFSGLRSLDSNWGSGAVLRRYELHLAATGDLLGSLSEKNAMLVMVFIPGWSTMKFWMFWPKLAK